ncbi:hypothetical protein ACHAXS_005381 [Conticribra weissflogii]
MHTCHLDIPWLPPQATEAHIVQGLAHTSLISIKQLCNHGCIVTNDALACRVYYNHCLVWIGQREPKTGLWVLPLQRKTPPSTISTTTSPTTHSVNSAYTMTSKASLLCYLHQCAFSPTIVTWTKAIDNGQFISWPGLTSAAVRKYLPPSPANDKGHMKRTHQNIRSTKKKEKQGSNDNNNPPMETMEEPKLMNLFCFAAIADLNKGTIYINNMGKFPHPCDQLESTKFVAAFQKQAVREFLNVQDIKVQIVEPNNHSVNAAKRAIQTFKDNFIAGLCTVDKNFLIQLWDQLLEQAQDSLNMLCTARINPKLSAYHILEGPHDFNKNPWAPPGLVQ